MPIEIVGLIILTIAFMFLMTFLKRKDKPKKHKKNKESSKEIGNRGESKVITEIKKMNFDAYHDVYLLSRDGVCQIDHIVKVGNSIIVIETKNYAQDVYGKEHSANWYVYYNKKKITDKNFIKQNYGHIESVKNIFANDVNVKGLIVFTGKGKFKDSTIPDVIHINELHDWLRKAFVAAGPKTNIDQAWQQLGVEIKARSGKEYKDKHMETVERAKNKKVLVEERQEPIMS